MDLCVFDILFYFILFYFIFNSDGSRSNEYAYHSDFLKYDFCYFYGHANLCLCILYFQYPSAFGNFLLYNSSRYSIWYSMFQHE
jgi:hypothetical protein